MADEEEKPVEQAPEAPEGEGKKPNRLFAHIKIVGFVAGVVFAETLVAYFLVPTAGETTAIALAVEEPKEVVDADKVPELPMETLDAVENATEFELGQYSITLAQPEKNRTIHIDFTLYGTVKTSEQSEMEGRYEKFQRRIMEQVEIIVRSADVTDLTDPGLGLIKRKILDKTNRILGKQFFKDVHLNQYSYVES